MIDTAAWAQAVLAANTPTVASSMMQLAVTGFATMQNVRVQRAISDLELDRLARRRSALMT